MNPSTCGALQLRSAGRWGPRPARNLDNNDLCGVAWIDPDGDGGPAVRELGDFDVAQDALGLGLVGLLAREVDEEAELADREVVHARAGLGEAEDAGLGVGAVEQDSPGAEALGEEVDAGHGGRDGEDDDDIALREARGSDHDVPGREEAHEDHEGARREEDGAEDEADHGSAAGGASGVLRSRRGLGSAEASEGLGAEVELAVHGGDALEDGDEAGAARLDLGLEDGGGGVEGALFFVGVGAEGGARDGLRHGDGDFVGPGPEGPEDLGVAALGGGDEGDGEAVLAVGLDVVAAAVAGGEPGAGGGEVEGAGGVAGEDAAEGLAVALEGDEVEGGLDEGAFSGRRGLGGGEQEGEEEEHLGGVDAGRGGELIAKGLPHGPRFLGFPGRELAVLEEGHEGGRRREGAADLGSEAQEGLGDGRARSG